MKRTAREVELTGEVDLLFLLLVKILFGECIEAGCHDGGVGSVVWKDPGEQRVDDSSSIVVLAALFLYLFCNSHSTTSTSASTLQGKICVCGNDQLSHPIFFHVTCLKCLSRGLCHHPIPPKEPQTP